jgi:hypothetical protein
MWTIWFLREFRNGDAFAFAFVVGFINFRSKFRKCDIAVFATIYVEGRPLGICGDRFTGIETGILGNDF